MGEQARALLMECDEVLVERGQEYGDAKTLFDNISGRFTLVLGRYVSPYNCARLMAELKAARLDTGFKDDTLLDQINYLALASELNLRDDSQ